MRDTGDGTLITIEGIDGAGTTTAARAIDDRYDHVTRTAEPTAFWTGDQVRKCISNSSTTCAYTDLYAFLMDRSYHTERIIQPAIESGETVVCDRYVDSTVVYQSIDLYRQGFVDTVDEGRQIVRSMLPKFFYEPDLTIVIDPDVGEALDRSAMADKYEGKREFQDTASRSMFTDIGGLDRSVLVDATRGEDEMVDDVLSIVGSYGVTERLKYP